MLLLFWVFLLLSHPSMESSILQLDVKRAFSQTQACTCAHTETCMCVHSHTQGPTAERGIIPLISAKASQSGAQTASRCRNRRRHLQHNGVLRTSASSSSYYCSLSSFSFRFFRFVFPLAQL